MIHDPTVNSIVKVQPTYVKSGGRTAQTIIEQAKQAPHRLPKKNLAAEDQEDLYKSVFIPMIRRVLPKMIASDIVGVQPISSDFWTAGLDAIISAQIVDEIDQDIMGELAKIADSTTLPELPVGVSKVDSGYFYCPYIPPLFPAKGL